MISKKYIDNKINLNEGEILIPILGIGIPILIFIVIPILSMLLHIYFVKSDIKNKVYKLHEKLTKKIRQITNFDLDVFIVNDESPNAWYDVATNKHIFITSGLIKLLDENEQIAVILHECGHYSNKDISKIKVFMTDPLINIALTLIVLPFFLTPVPEIGVLFRRLGFLIKHFIEIKTGRTKEYLADSFASEYGYGKYLISALNKIHDIVKREICKDQANDYNICRIKIRKIYIDDVHPEFEHRKININSNELKYIKKTIEDEKTGKPIQQQLVKKSYFELWSIFRKLKSEIKSFEKQEKENYKQYKKEQKRKK